MASKGTRAASSGRAPKALMAVDEQAAPVAGDHRRDLRHRIEHARRRLAVHHRDVGDRGVAREGGVQGGGIRRAILRHLQLCVGAAVVLAHAEHALAVGAVDEDEELSVRRHHGGQHRFHDEGAAPLQRDADVGALPARERRPAAPARARSAP